MSDPRDQRRYKAIAKAVIERDGECVICGTTENLTADHIEPVSKTGEDKWYDPENMQAMCMFHNRQKSDNTAGQVTDWINPTWLAWSQK